MSEQETIRLVAISFIFVFVLAMVITGYQAQRNVKMKNADNDSLVDTEE